MIQEASMLNVHYFKWNHSDVWFGSYFVWISFAGITLKHDNTKYLVYVNSLKTETFMPSIKDVIDFNSNNLNNNIHQPA